MSGQNDVQNVLPTVRQSQQAMEPHVSDAAKYASRFAAGDELHTFLQMLGCEPSPTPREEHRKAWH